MRMEPVTAVVLGAGARGRVYADYAKAHPEEIRIVAVAEPKADRLARFARDYGVPEAACYTDWAELLAQPRLADAALICTMDHLHYAPCMEAIRQGYQILLEKPMSPSAAECAAMQRAAEEKGVVLAVCHVLRYTPFFSKIKQLIDGGAVGEVQVIEQTEHVCYWHQAHSFVRGNWRRKDESAPMILAKCCHDLDLLSWMAGAACRSLSSYGGLAHFTAEHAPAGAPARCLDGCPASESCPYYAPKLYLTENTDWPTDTISVDMSLEARTEALRTGPYGRCVYRCDNDVVDHQVVAMEFENGIAATLTMTAFTPRLTRTVRVMGTKGMIEGDLEQCTVTLQPFGGEAQTFSAEVLGANAYGHGGGDVGLMHDFVLQVRGGGEGRTSAKQSLESHLMAFAAEQARVSGAAVELAAFERSL
ncbi:Gfo/Idh/MocA family protein [Allofournierella sp.]|uniref:Gfo/Idh/MocA family protein n=1 Tax=Allofournierella sp. TaxID=1940256 RepID=UPI003AB2A0E9